MGQPLPPGDMPLFEGLGTEWNDIVGALPEDRRAELAPRIKERIDRFEPLRQYEDFVKSGIGKDHIDTALNVFTILENKPREIYDAIGQHLGITPQQVKEVVEEIKEGDPNDPRIQRMEQQLNTLAEITLAQRQQELQAKEAAEVDAALDKELSDLKKKYGDEVNEEEILMRMEFKGLTAEQAFQEYSGMVSDIRRRRPAPAIMGSGGAVPRNAIDVTKLNNADTKNVVVQMLQHAASER